MGRQGGMEGKRGKAGEGKQCVVGPTKRTPSIPSRSVPFSIFLPFLSSSLPVHGYWNMVRACTPCGVVSVPGDSRSDDGLPGG